MLLLSELIRKTVVTTGQNTIPLNVFQYDNDMLSDIFEESLREYEKYRPNFKRAILPLSTDGHPLPDALRVKSIRLYQPSFVEFYEPLDFRYWELTDDKRLTCVYSGLFHVEYLAQYTYDYLLANLTNINYLTTGEDKLSFYMKDDFKKGSLNISVTDINTTLTYSLTEDLSSYKLYESFFTVDINTNVLSINENVGKKLGTGSIINLSNTGGTLPTGLNNTDDYYVIKESDISIKLANTFESAFNGVYIDLTDVGTGTHKLITKISTPIVRLIGTLGEGTYNSITKKVEIDILGSREGFVNASFRTASKGVLELGVDETVFMKLFKANFMISLGLNKSILKMGNDLPWDFSLDDLVSRGEKMKETLEEKEMPDKANWWNFR